MRAPRRTLWMALLMTSAVGALLVAGARPERSRGVDLAVPGYANANVSVAASGRVVAVSWAASRGGATDIYAAVSRDSGRTFGHPVRVNDAATRASITGEQPPRVVVIAPRAGSPAIVVVWTAKGRDGTRLLSARSNDGGASFGAPDPLPGSVARGNRGWESLAVEPDGRVVAVWLDHRDYKSGGGDGAARAEASKLYIARLGDRDARPIASGVCYCCKTGVAVAADGSIYAVWRHVYPGNVRDIAFTSSSDGGRTFGAPVAVSRDHWVLDGCPENGPAIAVDASRTVRVVWPTLVKGPAGRENLQLFYAVRRGADFSPRQALPTTGTPRHPSMAIGPDGSLLVAWDEQASGMRRVALARGIARGSAPPDFERVSTASPAGGEYPTVAATPDGFVVAWTTTGARPAIHVEQVAASGRGGPF